MKHYRDMTVLEAVTEYFMEDPVAFGAEVGMRTNPESIGEALLSSLAEVAEDESLKTGSDIATWVREIAEDMSSDAESCVHIGMRYKEWQDAK